MAQTVLVTGGCGFIASHLVEELAGRDYELRLLDNMFRGRESNVPNVKSKGTDIEILRGDIRDRDVVEVAVDGVDYVVHLAAVCLNRSIEFSHESLTVNTMGSHNVFEASAKEGVEKVLSASSASVYGNQDIPMRETDEMIPKTPYGTSKLACEHLLNFYRDQQDLDSLAYRFFNAYGPRQHTDAYYTSVINVFIQRLLEGEPPVIHGLGEQTMDFIHARDIARGLRLGLETETSVPVVNLGSGEMTSIANLAEILVDIVGSDESPEYVDRDVLVSERKASTERAREELGFETQIPIQEGLEDVVDWMRSKHDVDSVTLT
jgi:UDP-glucose 4-epimerase